MGFELVGDFLDDIRREVGDLVPLLLSVFAEEEPEGAVSEDGIEGVGALGVDDRDACGGEIRLVRPEGVGVVDEDRTDSAGGGVKVDDLLVAGGLDGTSGGEVERGGARILEGLEVERTVLAGLVSGDIGGYTELDEDGGDLGVDGYDMPERVLDFDNGVVRVVVFVELCDDEASGALAVGKGFGYGNVLVIDLAVVVGIGEGVVRKGVFLIPCEDFLHDGDIFGVDRRITVGVSVDGKIGTGRRNVLLLVITLGEDEGGSDTGYDDDNNCDYCYYLGVCHSWSIHPAYI